MASAESAHVHAANLRAIVDKLEQLRIQHAELEATRHTTRTTAFMQSAATTVKAMEYEGEYATLDLNRDILMMRAEIRTLEDRLTVELHLHALEH